MGKKLLSIFFPVFLFFLSSWSGFGQDCTGIPSVQISSNDDDNAICAGETVTFSAAAQHAGSNPKFQWRVNGVNQGSNSSSATFTSPSNFQNGSIVTVVLTPDCTEASPITSSGITTTVNPNPTVSAGGAMAIFCQGGTTQALGGSFGGGATSAVWSDNGAGGTFTNNSGSNPNNTTYTASASAPASITLTLTTAGGSCGIVSATKTLTVNPNPTVNAGNAISAICQGETTVALGGSFGGGATSAVWSDGGAGGTFINNSGSNPSSTTYTASATSPATITLTLSTAGGTCGSVQDSKTLTVNPNPTVNAGGAVTAICQGGTTAGLGGAVGGGATGGTWTTPAGGTFSPSATTLNATWTPPTEYSGTATLTLNTIGESCGTATASKTVTVNPNPTVNAGNAIAAICQGGTTVALGGSFGGGATSAKWTDGGAGGTFANNTGSTPNSVTYTASANAPASIVLTLTTAGGSCGTVSAAKTITVNSNPTVSAGAALTAICQGGTTAALGGSFGGGATSAIWSASVSGGSFSNNTGTTPNTATYTAPANAPSSVVLTLTTAGGSCGTVSATKTLTVTPTVTPSVSITSTSTAICTTTGAPVTFIATPGNGGTNPTYQWKNNGVNINGATGTTFSPTSLAAGSKITVEMTSNAVCPAPAKITSNEIAITTFTGSPANWTGSDGKITLPPSVCPPATIEVSIPAVANAQYYEWGLPPGFTIISGQGSNNITVSVGSNAIVGRNQNVTVQAFNPCGSNGSKSASLNVDSFTGVTVAKSTETVCAGGSVTVIGTLTGNAASGTWSAPSGTFTNIVNTSTTVTATYTPSITSGDIDLTITTNTPTGCSNTPGTSKIKLTVNQPPVITTQPLATQTLCSGSTATLSVAATGTGLTYQWRKDNTNIAGATAATLTLNNITTANAGNYSVVVSGASPCTSVTSQVSQLIINQAVAITAQPVATQTICSGTTANFSVTATGTELSYQWKKNGVDIANATSSTLAITNTTSSNSGNYTVVVSGMSPCSAVTSSVSALTVNDAIQITTQPAPTQTLCAGSEATFGVVASGTGLTYQWKKNGTNISNATSSTYTIENISSNDSGNYTVVVSGVAPCSGVTSSVASLTVNTPSVAPTSLSASVSSVCNGANTSVTLSQTGGSLGTGAVWKWYTDATYTTVVSGTVTAQGGIAVSPTATTTYYLRAENTADPCTPIVPGPSAGVTVTVNEPSIAPTALTASSPEICNGDNTSVTLTPTGGSLGSNAVWKWYTNSNYTTPVNGTVASDGIINVTPTVTTTYYLRAEGNAGPCTSNISGPSSGVTVTVSDPVTITKDLDNSEIFAVCAGFPIEFSVEATGTGLSYEWTRDGQPVGTNSATFKLNQAAESDAGMYKVLVKGTASCSDVSSKEVELKVNQSITISSQPVPVEICENTNTSISVAATGTGLTYQWRKDGIPISDVGPVSGTTSETLVFTGALANNAGSYDVVISGEGNTCSQIISTPATLKVNLNSTISLSSAAGTDSQIICINTAITPITYAVGGGGTGASITEGALPAGLSGAFNAGVFTISGTPTASGSFNYTVTTTGGCANVNISGSINVTPSNTLTLTSASATTTQELCVNTPITNITYTTTGATGADFTGLPAGVTGAWANNTVTISGTPTTADASSNYTVTLTGGCSVVTTTGTITVKPDNTIALSSAANTNTQSVCVGTPLTKITYATTGATGADFLGLPDGIVGSFANNTVTISGSPTTAGGPSNYTVTLTGGCTTVTATGTITVTPNNTVTLSSAANTNAQSVCVNTALTNITYATTGATGATVTGLPAGITGSWANNTVTISGKPTSTTAAGASTTYTVTLSGGCGAVTTTGTIAVRPDNTVTLSSAANTNAQSVCVNTAITSISYTTTGATGATFAGLPAGVTGTWANNTVTISGTPNTATAAGGQTTYTVTLTGGCSVVTATGTINVKPNNTITLSSAAGTNAQSVCINTALTNITYTTTGATGATFSGLPAGVTGSWANNIVTISGAPITAGGPSTYTVTLTGGCSNINAAGTINVDAKPVGGDVFLQGSTNKTIVVCHKADENSVTPLVLSGSTGSVVRWEYSANSGAIWTPVQNTTTTLSYTGITETRLYRAILKSGSCAEIPSAIAIVSVIPPDIKPTPVKASPEVVCLGTNIQLTSVSGFATGGIIASGGAFEQANPAGWLADGCDNCLNSGGSNTKVTGFRLSATNGGTYSGIGYRADGKFAISNGAFNSVMETPVFNLLGLNTAKLEFNHAYNLLAGSVATVEISTNGGTSYNVVLATFTGPSTLTPYTNFPKMEIDLSPYLGQTNLKIRFNYKSTNESSWAIDNIKIPDRPINETIEWTNEAGQVIGTTENIAVTPLKPGVNTFAVTSLINGCRSTGIGGTTFVDVYAYDNFIGEAKITEGQGTGCGNNEIQLTAKVISAYQKSQGGTGEIAEFSVSDTFTARWIVEGKSETESNAFFVDPMKRNTVFKTEVEGSYVAIWKITPKNAEGRAANPCGASEVKVPIVIKNCVALDFDGVDDYVDLVEGYATGPFSIEAWIRPKSKKADGTITNPEATIISGPKFEITMNDLAGYVSTDGRWYHIAASNGRLYIDGIDVKDFPLRDGSERAFIGAKWTAPNATNHFSGWIEEVRIWKGDISLENIRFTMNQRLKADGNIGVVVDMVHPDAPAFGSLAGYYQLLADPALITNGGYTPDLSNAAVDGKLRNMETMQENTAPLPYYTANDGSWDNAATWGEPTVWSVANTGGINWNIVKTSHNVDAERDIKVLGLISETATLDMKGKNPDGWESGAGGTGNELFISHYLLLNGIIDLNGESQLVQPEKSIVKSDTGSGGALHRDQQGTANSFNYNYWSSPVRPIFGELKYTVKSILKDGTSLSNSPVDVVFGSAYDFADNYTGAIRISNYWISIFNGAANEYGAWAFQYGSANPIKVGEGYTMKGTSGNVALSTAQNYTFVGLPNNGTIKLKSDIGRNYLIGNPYPSAIDTREFILDNIKDIREPGDNGRPGRGTVNRFDGNLYFWDHFGKKDSHILADYVGGYATYNLIGGVRAISDDSRIDNTGQVSPNANKFPKDFIPVGQSFFINTANVVGEGSYDISSDTIVFKNSQRIFHKEDDKSIFLKPDIVSKESKTKEIEKIRISYKSPLGYNRQILVGSTSTATNGFDLGYDAPIYDLNKEDMYWIQETNWLVIQGVSNFDKEQILPLGIVLEKEGEFTIKIDELENMDADKMVYINDKLNDSIHNLTKEPYVATSAGGYINDRFEIIFYKEPPIAPEKPTEPTEPIPGKTPPGLELNIRHGQDTNQLQISNPLQVDITNVYVYDLNGKLLQTYYNISNEKMVLLPVRNFSSGVYIVKLNAENQVLSKKIIINN